MKLWSFIFGSLCIVVGGCTSPSLSQPAASNATQPPAALATMVAGEYAGNWSTSDGTSGALRVTLAKPDNAPWTASVSFTYDGNDAATTMKSVAVDGRQILLAYEYKIQDREGAVEMKGELAGNTLQGSYAITKGDGNAGTWQATRVP